MQENCVCSVTYNCLTTLEMYYRDSVLALRQVSLNAAMIAKKKFTLAIRKTERLIK